MYPPRRARGAAVIAVSVALFCVPLFAGEWSRFRGPNGSGVSDSTGLPTEIGPDKNKAWEVSVPFGRSSPAIAGDRIFLTAVEDGKLITLALDRGSGKTLWRRELERSHPAEFHHDTDSSTSSPVSDGSNVYVFFHEAGLVSYDGSGKERWRFPLGPFRNFYGIASSPVLAGDTLLQLCDQAEGSFLLAVHKETGKELWRAKRPVRLESFSTPILYPDAEKPQAVLVYGSRWVDAYDVGSGKTVWTLGGVGAGPVASPVLAGNTLYVNAPDQAEEEWPDFATISKEHDKNNDGRLDRGEAEGLWLEEHFGWLDADADDVITAEDWEHLKNEMITDNWGVFAIRIPSGKGKPHILWNYRQNVSHIPSLTFYDDVLYMVKDGIVTSLDSKTGELLKRDRLGSGSSKVYASPVAADGKIYVSTLDGHVAVLEAGREWSVLSTNDFGDEIWASPAIVHSRIYLRTKNKLYCFTGETKPDVERSSS